MLKNHKIFVLTLMTGTALAAGAQAFAADAPATDVTPAHQAVETKAVVKETKHAAAIHKKHHTIAKKIEQTTKAERVKDTAYKGGGEAQR